MTINFKYLGFAKMAFACSVVATAFMLSFASCNKPGKGNEKPDIAVCQQDADQTGGNTASGKANTYQTMTSLMTVADIRGIEGSKSLEVIFSENTEFFTVSGMATINAIKDAFRSGTPLNVTFDPWQGVIVSVSAASANDAAVLKSRISLANTGIATDFSKVKLADEMLDNPAEMGIMNTTDPGLNNLIPDFATAQLMFDFISRQCCALPGPYAIDYCIPFQYCIDGCYARAHKMCWIINNKYKYGTKKIFSFANTAPDKLCVQGQKWGGCCIRWWYHVAPLVTIKTPAGPKAYVFDPAMFNQPVLLSTWLHAQENPACAAGFNPHVTMINVQPTSSYSPSGSSGLLFSTDPTYSATNSTLNTYSPRITCP
jgi:hypothetical protein